MRSTRPLVVTAAIAAWAIIAALATANNSALGDVAQASQPSPSPTPIILLYNAGLPSGLDDETSARYLSRLVYKLNRQHDFTFVSAGGGGSGSAIAGSDRTKLDALCQDKALKPAGVMVWQLFQERSVNDFIVFRRYRTDAQMALGLFRCTGSADSAVASAGVQLDNNRPGSPGYASGSSGSVPMLNVAAIFYLLNKGVDPQNKTAAIATSVFSSLSGFGAAIAFPEFGVNEPADRADEIDAVIDSGGDWFADQGCGPAWSSAAPDPDLAGQVRDEQAQIQTLGEAIRALSTDPTTLPSKSQRIAGAGAQSQIRELLRKIASARYQLSKKSSALQSIVKIVCNPSTSG